MSVFKWREYATDFDGKPVRMELKDLNREANTELMICNDVFLMSQNAKDMEREDLAAHLREVNKALDNFKPYFLESVKDIYVGEKEQPEDDLSAFYDAPKNTLLIMNVLSQLWKISNMTEEDQKN